jgi:hypothetical protein
MSRSLRAKLAVGPAVLLLAIARLLTVGPAAAEQTGRPDVVISFDGKISPRRLPRRRFAPVSLELSGSVRGTNGAPPPRLQRIELAFGARGGLDTAGLPVCPRARLRNATRRLALERCRAALVGRGEVSAEVPLNPAEPVLARAGVLAFNARSNGRPAVWVLANSTSPPVSFVLPLYLRRLPTGAYGVLMRSPVRRALGRWPRLRSFEITLARRYRAAGELRSYLNARCPLPPRFDELSVPVARATYYFAPRPTLIQPIRRLCQVRP